VNLLKKLIIPMKLFKNYSIRYKNRFGKPII